MITRLKCLLGAAAPLIGATLATIGLASPASAQENARPNILFILVDDLRWDQLSCAGHPVVRTPNIDRLAKEGANLRNAFVTTPLCSPSRASFFTGLYAHTHGIVGNETVKLRNFQTDDQLTTFPIILQNAGYETAHVGKWHMDDHDRPRRGFDHWASFRAQGVYNDGEWNVDGQPVSTRGYVTDVITDYAARFIRKDHAGKPWCLTVGHKAVHGPWTPADRHQNLYEPDAVPRAPSIHDDWEGKPVLSRSDGGTTKPAAGSTLQKLNPSDKTVRDTWRTLMAVDESVGQLLDTLKETGQLDNTMIVFTGDNGLFYSEHRLVDKRPAYEESIRVPLLMRYPQLIAAGSEPIGMALNVDFMATFCEIAQAQDVPANQGRSLIPLLAGRADDNWRDAAMFEYFQEARYPLWPDWRAVRTGRHKLIRYLDYPQFDELYDLQNDRYEMKNLIDDPSYATVLESLRKRLGELESESQLPATLPSPLPAR